MTKLEEFWPSATDVSQCILARHENVKSDAISLAVHQPMALHFKDIESGLLNEKTENDVLEKILNPNPEGRVECVLITGGTGAGKTHLIRWLEAQIKRDVRSKNTFKCIRIGKSASLRRVIEQIIEPLKGDKDFDHVLGFLENVVPEIDETAAANDLISKLSTLLENMAEDINATSSPTKEEKLKAHHAKHLHAYITSAALRQHVRDQVLVRIVRQAVSGNDNATDHSRKDFEQFETSDFEISDGTIDIGSADSMVVRYQGQLNDDETRQFACDVLNLVVSEAVGQVFQIENLAGGKSWGEVFLEIRKVFKKKGQELVFLVEDFFALTGFQQTIVKILIGEDESYGTEDECCNIRSAIGTTDGYKVYLDSYTGRAGGEFIVDNDYLTEEDALNATVNMVGNYLNAARWGKTKLGAHKFDNKKHWPNFYDSGDLSDVDEKIIQSFGFSEIGYPLFPFNKNAIVQLAKVHLLSAGQFSFNPRILIGKILHDVLAFRENFEKGTFPPSSIAAKGFSRKAEIDEYIDRINCGEADKERIATCITLWYGNPETVNAILPDKNIQGVFNLPNIKTDGVGAVPKPTPPPSPTPPTSPTPPPTPVPPPLPALPLPVNKWGEIFESWRTKEIGAEDANALRKAIRYFVIKRVRWDAIRVKKSAIEEQFLQSWIGIPRSRGGGQGGKHNIVIADDEEMLDKTGSLRKEMTAIGNYIEQKSWEFDGGALSMAQAYNLIDRLVPQFEALFVEIAKSELFPLLNSAKSMANMRGSPMEGESDWNSLFSNSDAKIPEDYTFQMTAYKEIYDLQRESFINAPHLQNLIFERSACYVGSSSTVYSVDITRFTDLPDSKRLNDLKSLFSENFGFFDGVQERKVETKAKKFVMQIESDVKEFQDVLSVVATTDLEDISSILSDAQGVGLLEGERDQIQGAFDMLDSTSIDPTTLTELEKITSLEQSFSVKTGKILALIDLKEFVKLQVNCNIIDEFFSSLTNRIALHPGSTAGSDLISIQQEIGNGLKQIRNQLDALIK